VEAVAQRGVAGMEGLLAGMAATPPPALPPGCRILHVVEGGRAYAAAAARKNAERVARRQAPLPAVSPESLAAAQVHLYVIAGLELQETVSLVRGGGGGQGGGGVRGFPRGARRPCVCGGGGRVLW
jgi:hypothetical protein